MKESESMASSSPSKPWPESRNGRIAVLAGIVGLFVPVFWLAMKTRQMLAATPAPLVVPANELDVGDVWEQGAFQHKLTIQNTTAKNIVIDGFRSTCGCVSVEPSALKIPSGQKADVLVTLNLKLSPRQDSNDFQVTIAPEIRDDPGVQPVWKIRGRARRLMKLTPVGISYYDNRLIQGQVFPSQTVIVTPAIVLDSLLAKYPAELATVEIARCQERHNDFQVNITPQKGLPLGPFLFDVLLEPVSKDKFLPIVKLPVEGRVMGDVQALPDSLALGARGIGETLTETITLRSISGVPFEVTRIKPDFKDTTVEPITVAGVSDKAFRICQHITRSGKQMFSLRFFVIKKNGECSTVLVNVSYHGTPVNEAALDREG